MFDLLKNLYVKAEDLKGKKLFVTLVFIFVVFTIVGIILGSILKKDEISTESANTVPKNKQEVVYEGKVVYVNPQLYPMDKVSYSLVDSSGKELFLLRADDHKLAISENLYVRITGRLSKLSDGKTDVIDVEEVTIKNATD